MLFDELAGPNLIDAMRVLGQPVDRVDGPLKTTGTAIYAYEHRDAAPDAAYGVIVGSTIAKGTIRSIDLVDASRAPGVVGIVTFENAGRIAKAKANTAALLAGPNVQHYDQAVALVVAETFEQARSAARLVRVDYLLAQGRYDLEAEMGDAAPVDDPYRMDADGSGIQEVGDFAKAFLAAPVKLDETYRTPDHSHQMMEPHASIAKWDGRALTLWTSNQMLGWALRDLSETLIMPQEQIRVISRFVGGGFGSKLWIRADAVMAALGARLTGRAVKVALARPQIMNNTIHRPATIQRIRIGTDLAGTITAIAHESWSGDLPGGMPETTTTQTRLLYSGANRLTAMRLAVLDLPEANMMRAPGDGPGLMALEVAIDEIAEKLGLDPVEMRIRNDSQVDPEKADRPFSARNLTGCLRTGAERFGWSRRNPKPAKVRDGEWLVGLGVAVAIHNNTNVTSAARVGIDSRGRVVVATDMTEIGNGSYTVLAQTAAEMMGVEVQDVVVQLGDSDFPRSAGSGGQWGGNCSTSSVYAACMKLRRAVTEKLDFSATETIFENGLVRSGNRSAPLIDVAGVSAEDVIEFGGLGKRFQQSTFGSHFVEVGVHRATAEVRVRRMLAVCAIGRVLNPKAARSQMIGAMTMGVGAALMEHAVVDKRLGFFVNHDLASYEVPVHADIPHQEVVFLDEVDETSSPMKAKGVGELGLCGVPAAIANAVYNACGVRVRDYPVTLDKLIDLLPAFNM